MEILSLKDNDERIGSVDEKNNLVYPGWDIFGKPILSRTTMQVMWLVPGQSFICFPPRADLEAYLVVMASDVTDAVIVDIGADSDRDAEDASPDDPLPEIAPEPAPVLDESALADMTKAQLLELANERGLTVSERMTKAHLIEALKP